MIIPSFGTGQQAKAETAPRSLPCRIRSEALLRGNKEVVIEHAGRQYRLRLTSRGKLILTA
jgi:hemin uptake protein HemP